jgi:hypothetical protein
MAKPMDGISGINCPDFWGCRAVSSVLRIPAAPNVRHCARVGKYVNFDIAEVKAALRKLSEQNGADKSNC